MNSKIKILKIYINNKLYPNGYDFNFKINQMKNLMNGNISPRV
jgi:hypothetical protein